MKNPKFIKQKNNGIIFVTFNAEIIIKPGLVEHGEYQCIFGNNDKNELELDTVEAMDINGYMINGNYIKHPGYKESPEKDKFKAIVESCITIFNLDSDIDDIVVKKIEASVKRMGVINFINEYSDLPKLSTK